MLLVVVLELSLISVNEQSSKHLRILRSNFARWWPLRVFASLGLLYSDLKMMTSLKLALNLSIQSIASEILRHDPYPKEIARFSQFIRFMFECSCTRFRC